MFVVISEGLGADYLKKESEKKGLSNLLLLPFQDYNQMPYVLGTADILLAILEKDAGVFSVPSKVLTYLCSAKPVVLAVPLNNQSAKMVLNIQAGYCSSPDNHNDFFNNINLLIESESLRNELGRNGRVYAEQHFKINNVALEFISIFKFLKNNNTL
ncbi:MAG: hypothetical protein MUE72_12455 [Chitinophagaceae bacterium]|nr:hypothetical protein [Chitinophagaceae bacterium]